MTTLGVVLFWTTALCAALWALDLVRRGQLYVGYGIVVLVVLGATAVTATIPPVTGFIVALLRSTFPSEPVAVIGLSAVLLLLIYVLSQLSILSDRVARLTQEIALRQTRGESSEKRADD